MHLEISRITDDLSTLFVHHTSSFKNINTVAIAVLTTTVFMFYRIYDKVREKESVRSP